MPPPSCGRFLHLSVVRKAMTYIPHLRPFSLFTNFDYTWLLLCNVRELTFDFKSPTSLSLSASVSRSITISASLSSPPSSTSLVRVASDMTHFCAVAQSARTGRYNFRNDRERLNHRGSHACITYGMHDDQPRRRCWTL